MTSKDQARARSVNRSDRRRKPTNPFTLSSVFGNRRTIRREEDLQFHYYVDRYGIRSAFFFLAALFLCVLDALITLRLVAAGGTEINPVMHFLLQLGPVPFLAGKYILTGSSLLFLLIHKEYRWLGGRVRGRSFLALVVVLYLLLLLWEAYLLVQLHNS